MKPEADEFIPTRRSLLSRLKDWSDNESWQDFFDTYWKLIYSVAVKAGLSDAEAQDVVQETLVSVAKKMPDFKYDPAAGSFKGWLLQLTRWRILNQLKKRRPEFGRDATPIASASRTATIERVADPASLAIDQQWEEEWQKNLLERALRRVKAQVDATHFQIFDCYVLKEWPVRDVARQFGVNPGQVYVIKHRLSKLLETEMQKLESE
jgi:RNA polymerase sigma factor (sigma-70 family)